MSNKKRLIFGLHAVQSVIRNHPEQVIKLMVLQGRHDHRLEKILKQTQGLSREYFKRSQLDEIANGGKHQGIIAECILTTNEQLLWDEEQLLVAIESSRSPVLVLILDGVTDPHNLGACLRTADAAGAMAVIAPKNNAVGITPVVSKVACGAAETVPFIAVTNLTRTLKKLQQAGLWVTGTSGVATQSLYDAKLTGSLAIVMGAEGKGMRRLTTETCDELIKIPMSGQVSSLNVSVATGVVLFEIVRQRRLSSE